MQQIKNKIPAIFSSRKVSVDQAIKLLNKNGVRVDENQAAIILDFLYLFAKTYNKVNVEFLDLTRSTP